MPFRAASPATRPQSHGASSRLPATRSFSIDERISAGSPSRDAHLPGDEVVGQRDALRARDGDGFAHRRLERRAQIRVARTPPTGWRARHVQPDSAARKTNFSHSARRMSGATSASMPCRACTRRRTPARGRRGDPSNAPTRSRAIEPGVRDDARGSRSSPRCTRRRPARAMRRVRASACRRCRRRSGTG